MRARARVLPGVSLGVATSARKFALFQLLLVETFSFLLTPPGASSSAATAAAGVLLQRKLSRVDFEPPHPCHQRHRSASRPVLHPAKRSNLPSPARRQTVSMGAASSNPGVSQRSALRPPLEPANNGYSYGAAITSLGASQSDAEAPADFEDSSAASLVGGETTIGELLWAVTGELPWAVTEMYPRGRYRRSCSG